MLWLVRYKILNEDIPDFLDYTKVFKIPTYQKKYKVANLEGPDFHQQWKGFLMHVEQTFQSDASAEETGSNGTI